MQSLRGNLANLPNALSHLINTTALPVEGTNFVPPTSPSFDSDTLTVSGDDSSDKSHAIPNSLIKEQWQLVLDQDATIDDLTNAIEKCKGTPHTVHFSCKRFYFVRSCSMPTKSDFETQRNC